MGRLIWLAALVACSKHSDAPPSPLQDGAVVAVVADAPLAIDAAVIIREAATPTKLVVGPHAACTVMSDSTVRCWGSNTEGQLGDGTTRSSSAAVAPNLRGVKDLVLGDDLACALIDDSSVVCWGKIGFGKDHRTLAPAAAPGVRDVVRIFAVGGAACGTEKSGALVCWGDVDARGHVTTTGNAHAPTPVPGVDHVAQLTAHAALTDDKKLVIWTDGGAPSPTSLGPATQLAERDGVPCVLRDSGDVVCVADHALCGAPLPLTAAPPPPAKLDKPKKKPKQKAKKPKPKPAPVATKLAAYALPEKATALAFDAGACVISQGKLDCFDLDHGCKLVRPWPAFVTVAETSGSCARLANGTVRCGTPGTPAAPLIAGVAGATVLAATAARGCALVKGHDVTCWEGTTPASPIAMP